jgi:hypothetical protein
MHRQAKSLLANAGYKTGYNLACAEGNDKPRLSQAWILDGYFGNNSPFLGFVPGFSRYTWPSWPRWPEDRIKAWSRAAPCECRKSHEMGAVPNPLLITAGGRLMILEQVRFGVSSLTVNKKQIVWKRLPSELIPQTPRFCRLFVCQLLRCFCYLKKLETPMIWALLWLQGLQVLPVSGPTFGQSCGLQSTHYLLPDFGSPLKVSKTWLKSDRPW